jgi:hypothetical protein
MILYLNFFSLLIMTASVIFIISRVLYIEVKNRNYMTIERTLIAFLTVNIINAVLIQIKINEIMLLLCSIISFILSMIFYDTIYEPFTTRRKNGDDNGSNNNLEKNESKGN